MGVDRPRAQAAGPVLSVRDVSVSFPGRDVLRDVSFTIRPGEFTGLIGSNGAGKTTLLRVILGLHAADRGEVLVGGERLARRNRGIGYVPQKFLLDREMPLRARDLVGLGLDGHRLGISRPSRRKWVLVDEMLEAVDAGRSADARIGELSGGEQQRVLIAHALISRPRLLLLDEPLANLDLGGGQEVVSLLAGLARERGIGILLSAHELNPLLPVLDRVVYLAAGRAASGPVGEVVRSEVLSRLYGRRVDVLNVRGRVLVVAGGDEEDGSGESVGRGALEIVS